MDKLIVSATADVPEEYLNYLKHDLGYKHFHRATSRRLLLNVDPPSFIEIVGSLISWKTILVASSTVFFSTLAKKLAEDLYDNKSVLSDAVFSALLNVSKTIAGINVDTPKKTYIVISISAPEGIPNPSIKISDNSEEKVAFTLACFYAVADIIIEELIKISEKYEGGISPPSISISEKGEVSVRCYTKTKHERIEFTISLRE